MFFSENNNNNSIMVKRRPKRSSRRTIVAETNVQHEETQESNKRPFEQEITNVETPPLEQIPPSEPARKRRKISRKESSALEEPQIDLTQDEPSTSQELPNNAIECAICYEVIKEQGVIDCCRHEFCHACILKWSNESNTCPVCKQRLSTIRRKRLDTGKLSRPLRIPERNFHAEPDSYPALIFYFDYDSDEDDDFYLDEDFYLDDDDEDEERIEFFYRFLTNYFDVATDMHNRTTPIFINSSEDPIIVSDDEN